MLATVGETLRKFNMLESGDHVLVAVSGGPDSVALLYALWELREELNIKLTVIHVNHQLRGRDSDEDAEYVRGLAEGLGLPSIIECVDVSSYWKGSGLSKQMAARELRYGLMEERHREMGASKVALGHNANDQVETVLMNLIKGSGLEGLMGIPPVRDIYIRPLIEVSRSEIVAYCKSKGVEPVLDRSNLQPIYLRNKMRLELIPLLEKEYNPAFQKALLRLVDILRHEDQLLESLVEAQEGRVVEGGGEDGIIIAVDTFNELPVALKRRIIRKVWQELTGDSQGLFFEQVNHIIKIAAENGGTTSFDIGKGIKITKSYNQLIFGNNEKVVTGFFQHQLVVPGQTEIPELGLVITSQLVRREDFNPRDKKTIAYLDWEKVKSHLYVRQRKQGDRFHLLGSKGAKKLKEFFIDKKIPKSERDRIPLVCWEDEVLWIPGHSVSEPYRVRTDTVKVLRLELRKFC